MILVAHEIGSRELQPLIKQLGVQSEIYQLPFGDFAFEGNGPKGGINIGVERKTLHDMLHCIDDSRYSGHQKPGMDSLYDVKYLIMEGRWKRHKESGLLMEGNERGQFWICKPSGRPVMYSKLRRYLFSISLSGVIVMQTSSMEHTASDLVELFYYWQKPWSGHTSMLELPKVSIPCIIGKPPLVHRWAKEIDEVGVKKSEEAKFLFKRPIVMATALPDEWMKIKGIGKATAEKIVKEIIG